MSGVTNPAPDSLDAASVLRFWFGEEMTAETVGESAEDMWFRNGAAYDTQVREGFGAYLDAAAAGAFDRWADTPRGRLALPQQVVNIMSFFASTGLLGTHAAGIGVVVMHATSKHDVRTKSDECQTMNGASKHEIDFSVGSRWIVHSAGGRVNLSPGFARLLSYS